MNRKKLIKEIKELLNPGPKNIEVFYQDHRTCELPKQEQLFKWNDRIITYAEAAKIPAKMGIFVCYKSDPIPSFKK